MRRNINSRVTLERNIGFNRLFHSPLLRLWKRITLRQAKRKLHAVFCRRLWRDHRVPKYLKAMVIGALLYGLSPVDLIPESFVPLVGQLDDATLLLLASYVLIRWSPQEVVSEHMASIGSNFGGRLRPWLS